jgi:hypothetical protein
MSLLLSLALLSGAAGVRADDPTVTVKVDSARHEITVQAGTFELPNMPPMTDHGMMDLGMSHDTPVQHFAWPVDGWFRGFKLEVRDSAGRLLPRRIMHHMIVVNYSRRQLLYQAAERLFGAGTETEDASIPATIGVPMTPGSDIGFYVAWHNDTGEDLHGVVLTMRLQYSPRNQNPRPVDVMPLYMDVNLTVGGTNTFDVPAGKSTKSWEFEMPIDGRLLGLSGHLHDYGQMVTLVEIESGRRLARVTSTRDSAGRVLRISRSLPGVRGSGIRMRAGHHYRVTGFYDNPTGAVLKNGAMAHMVALFAPEDLRQWPGIDQNDPIFQRDLAALEMQGMDMSGGDAGHDHNSHNH